MKEKAQFKAALRHRCTNFQKCRTTSKCNVSERDKVTRKWRKLLTGLYFTLNIVQVIKLRKMRWAGHVAHIGVKSDLYRVLVGKPDGKKPLVRPRCI